MFVVHHTRTICVLVDHESLCVPKLEDVSEESAPEKPEGVAVYLHLCVAPCFWQMKRSLSRLEPFNFGVGTSCLSLRHLRFSIDEFSYFPSFNW